MEKIFAFMLVCFSLLQTAVLASEFRFSPHPNKAHLIHWRSWGQDVFDEATKKDGLILLSLSAAWCHWCHVMDETTYSDPEVIKYINENFIPVRVDADMRPDIDSIYNQGGWPSTAILTPQGEVISGGNYFSPQEMLGRLERAAALMRSDRAAIGDRIEEMKAMKELRALRQGGFAGSPDTGTVDDILQLVKSSFDDKHGGFGEGQKFPSPDTIDFLLSPYVRQKDRGTLKIVSTTLDHMAQGELFDKVEGGFFRYATKPDWSEPHYEKMLDVNAGMIRNYADAYLVFKKKEYLQTLTETIRYVQNNLYDKASGAFSGSQDADEEYYRKSNRKGMKSPPVDRTAYADSSSLMISALIAAHGATGEKQYLDMATTSGALLLEKLYSENDGVHHYYSGEAPRLKGLLSDNVLFGSALLDLYNATGEKKYLQKAKQVGQLVIDRFYDAGLKRFRATLDTSLKKPVTAGVLSEVNDDLANYRALRFLCRLAYTGDNPRIEEIRDAASRTLAPEYRQYPPYAAAYGTAVLWIAGEPVQIMILADGERARKYLAVINSIYIPQKVVRVLSLSEDAEEIKKLKYALKESVYLCAGKRCSAAIRDVSRLKAELTSFIRKQREN